jgi:3-hydroxyanthranilate 3,4-dioxygenase
MMPTFNLKQWIDDNRDKLKPPVGNQTIYKDQDFIVMIVGGPNARKDYHHNHGEELFYQIEGDINVRIMENGQPKDIPIKAGEMFLLPANVQHSPQRGPNTIGMVIERRRAEDELDGFIWYCEKCDHKLYEEYMPVKNIVTDLPKVFDRFWNDEKNHTCSACGTVMQKPGQKTA